MSTRGSSCCPWKNVYACVQKNRRKNCMANNIAGLSMNKQLKMNEENKFAKVQVKQRCQWIATYHHQSILTHHS